MEAVPRMFMLSLELKWSLEKVDFGPNLRQYIQGHYMEDPNKYNDEIKQLDQLRVNATNVSRDFNGISTLKKYYGQLQLLTSRFPITDGGEAAPIFTWIDTFHEEPFSHADAAFDQACILYNLGVLHSILGAKESRASEEEMKVACTHFQCAAGVFSYLKDHFQSYMSPDISFDLMTIYINLMLGHAQECLLEKSMQDNRKSSLVARISMQVIDYYRHALRGLEDGNIGSLMGSRRSKTWKKTIQVKITHFLSVAYMYMSNQADEQQKHGERVSWLQQAVDRHNEAMKLSKGVHESILEALSFTKDVVAGKFQAAKKDNDFVYHDQVPPFENLPEIKGASLVKALTFQPYDESIAGPDIFKKLVPMKAHEASSLYSEEKAKLLRRIGDAIEDKSKHLEHFMTSLQLDQIKLDSADEPERLPQVMLEVCAALSVKTEPVKQLVQCMRELSSVVLDVSADVKELQGILDEEDKQESDFQKERGKRPTKIMDEIKQEFSKYREGHDKASKSNQELHRAMQVHIENIRKLAGPLDELQASLPSGRDAQSSDDKEVASKLRMLVKKVDEMKKQRASLETQLRDQLRADDITSRIVTTEGGSLRALFEDEMKKHDTLTTYIEQNLSAQDNILKALTETNAAYADTRKKHADISKKREDKIQELIGSYTVYDDLLAKSRKGIDFYNKLQLGLRKLQTRTDGVVKVKQEEREAVMARLRPKPVQARPTAPKPVLPVDPAPAGPKLSDFWKPKSSTFNPAIGGGNVSDVPMMPAAVSGQYPGSRDQGGPPANTMPPGAHPGQALARHSSFDSASGLSSLDGQRPPSQSPAFAHPGPGSPLHASQSSGLPYDRSRMPYRSPSAPLSQPSAAPVSNPGHPHAPGHAGPRVQPPHPSASYPGSVPQSQSPMMPPAGARQPMPPASRPQMQPPMVPQPFDPSQPPQQAAHPQQMQVSHSQNQPGYPTVGSVPFNSNPQPSVPGTHQPHANNQAQGIQARPHTSTAMVSSVATPIPSAVTRPPVDGQTLGQHQHVSPGAGPQLSHPSTQVQHQPPTMSQSNLPPQPQQIIMPQQMSQSQPGYQNVTQPSQQPMALLPGSNSPYPVSQSQPQQSTSQAMSHQQGVSQQPSIQATNPALQQQQHAYQQPTQQFTQTPTASPQHRPQQVYAQPGTSTQSGPQHMGHQQHHHMQANQTPTASPQHMRPPQQVQAQPSPNQHASFGQGIPQYQQQQQQQPQQQQQQQQQQQPQPQFQQHPSSQAQFSAPQTHQGSPVRHGPQSIPPGGGQQPHPSQAPGQPAYHPQQPGSTQTLPPSSQAVSTPGATMLGARPSGGQPTSVGQPVGYTGQPMAPAGQQPAVSQGIPTGLGQGTMGHPPGTASQAPFSQAGGQAWSQPQQQQQHQQYQHQQPVSGQQSQPVQQHPGPGVALGQPYTRQSQPQQQQQQSGQFASVQQGMGYPSQSQTPQQGFSQTNPAQFPPGASPQNHRVPPTGNPSTPRMQTPIHVHPQPPGASRPFQSGPSPVTDPSHAGVPMQQPHASAVPFRAGSPGQPYQRPSQPSLNQVQQVNRALKEEQRRLPQPSLQPLKVEPSSRDLLSNSPDNEQISLSKPLIPQTDTSEASPEQPQIGSPTAATASPPQTYSSSEAALSDVFKQAGLPSTSTQPHKSADSQASVKLPLPGPGAKPSTSAQPATARPFPKSKDPYDDKQTLDKFVDEVERFEKYVDGLGKQMLSGPTVLDGLWKELSEAQDRDTRQYSIAVARCYSIKNRHPDVMPYDHNRVKLQTGKDDYLNASFIDDLSPASPRFIATQAPLPSTYNDFWLMVYEQQVSLIAMLVSQTPAAKSKADFDPYWPEERGQVKTYGSILISLQSQRTTDHQTDRTFHLIHKDTRQERTVFQHQFTAWPEFGVSSRPADLLQYISDLNGFYMQQRRLSTPIVVHCNSGVGRTGTFCLIYSAVREMMCGGGIVDIPRQVKTLRQQRRGMVAEKEQLKFTYMAVLCFAQQILAKRGISVKCSASSPQVDLKHLQRITSFDVIMGSDSVTSLHSRISKMSVRTASEETTPVPETAGPDFQDNLTNPGSLSPVSDSESSNQTPSLPPEAESETLAEAPSSDKAADSAAKSLSPSDPSPSLAVQAPPTLVELTESNLTDFSLNPPQFIPDVVESSQQEGGDPAQCSSNPGDGSLPSILADLTPQNFSITGKAKQRITKTDFTEQRSVLGNSQAVDDPLDSLDPLWTMKTKGENNAS